MNIRLLKPYQLLPPGSIMDVGEPVAVLLVERGVAILHPPKTKAVDAPPKDKMFRRSRTRRKAVDDGGGT